MASIIKANINLNEIPKDKVYKGKKGSYLPITITINDEVDQFGNQGPVVVEQSKEEREAKVAKVYLGNIKVVWTNGDNVAAAPRTDQPQQAAQSPAQSFAPQDDDWPFEWNNASFARETCPKKSTIFVIYALIAGMENN